MSVGGGMFRGRVNYHRNPHEGARLTPRQWVFTAIFLLVAIGGSFAIAGGNQGLAAFFLFLLFPIGAVVAIVVRALRPAKGRILLLRKFHTERPPNFPVSRLMSFIDRYGYEVVTLADTLVRKTPDRLLTMILCGVIAGCVSLAGTFLPIIAFITTPVVAGMFLEIVTLGMIEPWATEVLVALSTIVVTVGATVFWARRLRPWRRAAREEVLETTIAFLLKYAPGGWRDWSRLDAAQLECAASKPIRRFSDTGLVVVHCSDENWRSAVENLIRSSVAVCIDISNPSDHIRTEVALIAEHAARRAIWLRQEGAPSPFLNWPLGGYSIYGHDFVGARFDFPYPADPGGELHAQLGGARLEIDRHAERLLRFLQALTTSAAPSA